MDKGIFERLFKDKNEPVQTRKTYLLVGLGNPGREYRMTRHNIGFMVIDRLCEDFNIHLSRMQSKALIGMGNNGEARIVLAKPQTFMNLSGQSVSQLVRFYKIPLEQLLVIHDDLDMVFGKLRMRPGGRSPGQKGVTDTINRLGTQDFPRLRIGVGRPPGQMAVPDYLLQDFTKAEQEALPLITQKAAMAARAFVEQGLENAMNQYNGALLEE